YADLYSFFFFFSSRRRHTRFDCDWSSDVCSSDLTAGLFASSTILDDKLSASFGGARNGRPPGPTASRTPGISVAATGSPAAIHRSEERRVGKEWRTRGWRGRLKKKTRRKTRKRDE